jgi:mannose/cellobiose epimerase-like protein (N-acyl-D-glucosamine 2-epimerase family)
VELIVRASRQLAPQEPGNFQTDLKMAPDFRSRTTLLNHIRHTKQFYDARCTDPSGGLYHFYKDDGTVYDAHTRHLVSSTRFVFNYAMAWRQFGDARIGSACATRWPCAMRTAIRPPAATPGSWTGTTARPRHRRHQPLLRPGLRAAGLQPRADGRRNAGRAAETFELMEQRFWDPKHGLYADEASADWSHLDGYPRPERQYARLRSADRRV